MILETTSRRESETIGIGMALARLLRPGDVIALSGELGAGKTRFVRGLARGLGVDERLLGSPTFVLMHEYPAATQSIAALIHADAYRLTGGDELPEDVIAPGAGDAVSVVEWADRVSEQLPDSALRVRLSHVDQQTRAVSIRVPEQWRDRAEQLREALFPEAGTRGCPACGEPVDSDDAHAPFCSSRCRMADLGAWFDESYRISRPIEQRDLEEGVD